MEEQGLDGGLTHLIVIKLNDVSCNWGIKLNSFKELHSLRSCNYLNSFNLFPDCTQNRLI